MLKHLLRPFSFLPAILMMYLIFSFSAQDGETSAQLSYKVSYKLIEIGAEVLEADFEPWEIENLAVRFQGPIRKLAHMTEYCMLAVCISFPLYVYGLRGILLMLFAGILCVGFACTDEYHQAFVAGRGPSKRDVAIDSCGVLIGILFVRIVGWIGRKTIFRPLINRKKQKPAPAPVHESETSVYGSNAAARPETKFQPQIEPEPEPEYISDQLSEDMSFKKLLKDLKERRM